MEDWIRGLISDATAPIRTLVASITARITSVWSVITAFFAAGYRAWLRLRSGVASWVAAQLRHAAAVLTTLRYIVLVYIPRKLVQAGTAIRTWAAGLIAGAINTARGLFNAVMSWASTQVHNLLDALGRLGSWARQQVQGITDLLGRVAKLVFALLTAPERLAAWLVGAMFHALLRFALDNADHIAAALWSRRRTVFLVVDRWLEMVLSRII